MLLDTMLGVSITIFFWNPYTKINFNQNWQWMVRIEMIIWKLMQKYLGLRIYSAVLGGSNQRKIVFKDSLNFLSGSLASLFTTFELQKDGYRQKPFFPHFFNIKSNLDVELNHLPDQKYYGTEQMSAIELAEFQQWHEMNCQGHFNLRASLVEYCTNDVQILRLYFLFFLFTWN